MDDAALDWDELDRWKHHGEEAAIAWLLRAPSLHDADRGPAGAVAADLVAAVRGSSRSGVVESFLQEYALTSREGMALMCLAEALLRTPDAASRDALIAETIGPADWARHLGHSPSLFVNASTWGLMLSGRLIEVDADVRADPVAWLRRMTQQMGEPLIRRAMVAAVRIIGEQFVLGPTVEAALRRADQQGYLCSFDMLGEGARTETDAERYQQLYVDAIKRVGAHDADRASGDRHGVSVKLSALSPRYEPVQEARVWRELYPRLLQLAELAAAHDLALSIDAEEADRLVLSLRLVDRLTRESALARWSGLGVVVQAYQKRAPQVIDRIVALARARGRRINVRLVKGAYWDSEIKRAQIAGRPDYPVFSSKPATDAAYLACARLLIEAGPDVHPQFATHNAHTLAAVHAMARRGGADVEFQRLHGMGEQLYAAAAARLGLAAPRVYAPVGGHEALLPYLVRRLLENGANTSFVHALFDEAVPVEALVADPLAALAAAPHRHPRLPPPPLIYEGRRNPIGRDYATTQARGIAALAQAGTRAIGPWSAATPDGIDRAIAAARAAQPAWDEAGGTARAAVLRAMGDALERDMDRLAALLAAEAGKTLNDGVAEVREAIDYCRYYALEAERLFASPVPLRGAVGEANSLALRGRGIFACISPWNFPLAIFTGQIAAALAAGNAALAKPAEQTPRIAMEAVRLFHGVGLDPRLLALLPGAGEAVGAALVAHAGIDGVAFTGGTETAQAINRALAARPGPILPFIAETGGLNAMFVDSTALREQVIDDVLLSAFGSAGQRCSALRMLYLPEERADELIGSLCGALDTLVLGDPADPATDIGPVIDEAAREALEAHVDRLRGDALRFHRHHGVGKGAIGSFFAPVIAEVPRPDYLEREVFGPILHVHRHARGDLPRVARALAARGYGLTLGIHSRLESFAQEVRRLVPAGNVYVNRSMIGAVVGVQPFGGEGLSGTGPKAGGPNSLMRYAVERSLSVNIAAQGGDPELFNLSPDDNS